jgi:hypothetical protein
VAAVTERFVAVAEARRQGGVTVRVPFDPAAAWGGRDAYHVNGTLHGWRYRGALTDTGGWRLELGPSWCRAPGFVPGDEVVVEMALEGPQSATIGDDVAAAFQSEPDAARFFDSMPTFYRNNAARSIEGAKRPETRARRIAEVVERAKRHEREA